MTTSLIGIKILLSDTVKSNLRGLNLNADHV